MGEKSNVRLWAHQCSVPSQWLSTLLLCFALYSVTSALFPLLRFLLSAVECSVRAMFALLACSSFGRDSNVCLQANQCPFLRWWSTLLLCLLGILFCSSSLQLTSSCMQWFVQRWQCGSVSNFGCPGMTDLTRFLSHPLPLLTNRCTVLHAVVVC